MRRSVFLDRQFTVAWCEQFSSGRENVDKTTCGHTGNSNAQRPYGAETVSRHNEVMTPVRTKMSSTGHIRDWNAVIHEVPGSLVMKAVMHHRHELELHSFRHFESMKVDKHKLPQIATKLSRIVVRAAAFKRRCNLSVAAFCAPASSTLQ